MAYESQVKKGGSYADNKNVLAVYQIFTTLETV